MANINNTDIGGLIRKLEQSYENSTPTKISDHVDFDLREHVSHILAYKYSRHISGSTDSKGREKPFFNIGTAVANLWYRATDIDRKDIRLRPTKSEDYLLSFAANVKLQDFMRREDFGTFLNKWGRNLADYGSAVVKFVEKDGQLHADVCSWSNLIVDPVSFDNAPVIEVIDYTPDQLLQHKGYDQEQVKALIDAREARENERGEDMDTKSEFIRVYEVHGMLPKSMRTGEDEDRHKYEQQMFVCAFVAGKEKGEYDDFVLASGREERHPYMITHLIEEDERVMGIGAYEHVFEAQWMANHTAKSIKDHLDLASKLIFQTADENFVGVNALEAIETGDILVHADNQPLTQMNNSSHDIASLQAFGQQWEVLAKEITSTPDAIRGDTMPSGTAYRSVAIQNRESHSLFELMIENKGLAIERMMRTFVIPYIKKQLNTTKEISALLEAHDIEFIDPKYIRYKKTKAAKDAVKDILLSGNIDQLPNVNPDEIEQGIRSELKELGNQRFLKPSEIPGKTWSEVLKDMEWDLEVEVTNENTNKEVTMTTLTTVLQTIASNPAILQDKNASMLFNKILSSTGEVSPIELSQASAQPTPQAQPQQAPAEALSSLRPQEPASTP